MENNFVADRFDDMRKLFMALINSALHDIELESGTKWQTNF